VIELKLASGDADPNAAGCVCGCGSDHAAQSAREKGSARTSGGYAVAEYTVVGMTCGHCVTSVREEVGVLEGVTSVDVDLDSGRLTIISDLPIGRQSVEAAVGEAGYRLSPATPVAELTD
jgi:copper chaperone CopZ